MKRILLLLISMVAVVQGFAQTTYSIGFGYNHFRYDSYDREVMHGISMPIGFQKKLNERVSMGTGLIINSNREITYQWGYISEDTREITGDVTYSSINYMIPVTFRFDVAKGKFFATSSFAFYFDDIYRYNYVFSPAELEEEYLKETGLRPAGLGLSYQAGFEYLVTNWAGVNLNFVTASAAEHLNYYINLGINFHFHKTSKKDE